MSDLAPVKIHIFPGGRLPTRQTKEAVGFDIGARAIVSPYEKDATTPALYKTLFDFKNIPEERELRSHIKRGGSGRELFWRLDPGERISVGTGFAVEMRFPVFYWLLERSNLVNKHGVKVLNAGVPIDSDYRGEVTVSLFNMSQEPFFISCGMRIAQITFQEAVIPRLVEVPYSELSPTLRGVLGLGSTGLV